MCIANDVCRLHTYIHTRTAANIYTHTRVFEKYSWFQRKVSSKRCESVCAGCIHTYMQHTYTLTYTSMCMWLKHDIILKKKWFWNVSFVFEMFHLFLKCFVCFRKMISCDIMFHLFARRNAQTNETWYHFSKTNETWHHFFKNKWIMISFFKNKWNVI